MVNRKELDQKIKDALINKYGNGEFHAKWDELYELLNPLNPKWSVQQIKYHIYKLEEQGFLRVVSKSKRSEGYTSPNVIKILDYEIPTTNENPEEVVNDITKQMTALRVEAKKIEYYKQEVVRLTNQSNMWEKKYDDLFKEVLQLRQTISDFGLRGNNT